MSFTPTFLDRVQEICRDIDQTRSLEALYENLAYYLAKVGDAHDKNAGASAFMTIVKYNSAGHTFQVTQGIGRYTAAASSILDDDLIRVQLDNAARQRSNHYSRGAVTFCFPHLENLAILVHVELAQEIAPQARELLNFINDKVVSAIKTHSLAKQATRTGRINEVRGLLREHGCPVPVGARTVLARVTAILDDPARALPTVLRQTVAHLVEEVRSLEARVIAVDRELARVARAHPVATRLQQVPGVGIVTATAMVGSVGHIHAFRRGRDFASWLGLTPRESTTGTRRYLGRISKRGDGYLRCLLTHGARAVLLAAQRTARTSPHRLTRLQQWAVTVAARRGHNKAAIALANKLARIDWATWKLGMVFNPDQAGEGATV